MLSTISARNNYVLVKSSTDFPAPIGGIITLLPGTLYEINGTINLAVKTQLNGCSVVGQDGNNDKLIYSGFGKLFTGVKGGILRQLTIMASAGSIFNINGANALVSMIVSKLLFFK